MLATVNDTRAAAGVSDDDAEKVIDKDGERDVDAFVGKRASSDDTGSVVASCHRVTAGS